MKKLRKNSANNMYIYHINANKIEEKTLNETAKRKK